MKNKGAYFKLFSNCIPVKGPKRAIICDLQRGSYIHIPNSFVSFFHKLSSNKIETVLYNLEKNEKLIAQSYIDFAEKHDLGFYTDNLDNFPDLNLNFITPYKLNDIIIEFSPLVSKFEDKLVDEFIELGLQFIEFRITEKDLVITQNFISKLMKTRIRGITLFVSEDNSLHCQNIHDLIIKYSIITYIVIHNVSDSKIDTYLNLESDKVSVTKEKITNNSCGIIEPETFTSSLQFYLESLSNNNCLNRKLSIDVNGDIKNCPSLKNKLGNINDNNLSDALNNKHYEKLSSITKSQINICKDCEYRMICSDCRAYVSNIYDKPLKCKYDPYGDAPF